MLHREFFGSILLLITIMTTSAQNTTALKKVELTTNYGSMVVELYNETPLHRDNFIRLVTENFYDSSEFHRIIKGFMIQGGGHRQGSSDAGYTLEAEIIPGMMHKRGALAAARQGDAVNPQKRSSGSQFYIVDGRVFTPGELEMLEKRMGKSFSPEQMNTYTTLGGAPHLDDEYTVFGALVSGFDVLDKIATAKTSRGDRPLETIWMKAKIIE
ncbi:MAG TPA: peptidylprolyl isomerase [Bacteroidales bacterium]|nr:peptidylprolyl isomerase [Bacteroidales bacterium]